MAKHTAGPWKLIDESAIGCREIVSEIDGICDTVGLSDDDEDAANARLICAAPELLAELHVLRSFIVKACGETAPYARVAINRIDSLIDRAEKV